ARFYALRIQPVIKDLAGNGSGRRRAPAPVLHNDGHRNLRTLHGRVGHEQGVVAQALVDGVGVITRAPQTVDLGGARFAGRLISGVLEDATGHATKRLAVKLSKICNDLRLLSSGPRAGFFEINLPPMQPGSSIMPGKVNPVIPEVVNQVCYKVIGNDLTV